MKKDECLFCKIIAGEIPSNKVYEDDTVLAFEDVNPMMPSHTLIVPKDHYTNLNDDIPEDLLGHLFACVRKVAREKGVSESGYRIVVNNGEDAQQVVKHVHVHVLGGAVMNSGDPSIQ